MSQRTVNLKQIENDWITARCTFAAECAEVLVAGEFYELIK